MIDNELLAAFVSELDALRVQGRDFARSYPDVASRLDIGDHRSGDGQVERLVQATAFLAARLRLMIDRSATELPLTMLTLIAPSLVEPVPSFAVIELDGGTDEQEIARFTRFDARIGGGSLVAWSAAMNLRVAPFDVSVRRLEPSAGSQDGLAVRLNGVPPAPLTFYVGKNERTAAALMDAFCEHLVDIEVVSEGAEPVRVSMRQMRVRGFGRDDAALPLRPATHPAHRVVTEFIVFPDKFRFITLNVGGFKSGDEIRFRFSRAVAIPGQLDADVLSVNRLAVVNLWPTVSAPVNVDGRRLEYPVRVDALRYRAVECHSVESLEMFQGGQAAAQLLDPVFSLGNLRGTPIKWGARREMSRTGSQLYLYFRGLDYATLGRRQMLATGNVLASNRDQAQYLRTGSAVVPMDPTGGWRGRIVAPPTPYLPGLRGAQALETMIGYLNSGMVGLVGEARRGVLQDYLKRFPGAERAAWIDGIRGAATRPVMTTRGREQQAGIGLVLGYEASNYPSTSRGSQRGLNRVEDIEIDAD